MSEAANKTTDGRSALSGHFSHLYIEDAVAEEPLTSEICERFPKAVQIPISDYRDVFGRPGQNFQLQKSAKKLILAAKKDHYLYPGNDKVQDFGYPNFHYNTVLLNCLYNCAYCYLQGMFASANMVAFVNEGSFYEATLKAIRNRKDPNSPLYLAISYDTDLLASESMLPFCGRWVDFSRGQKDMIIEIRTKSANFKALRGIQPHARAVIAWTLSPEEVIARYEQGTPRLAQRVAAIKKAIAAGWSVRLCFDPVLRIANWQSIYDDFFRFVFDEIPAETLRDVSLGLFRINYQYFTRLKKNRPDTDLVYQNFQREGNTLTLPQPEKTAMTEQLTQMLGRYLPSEKLEVWT